MRTDLNTSCPHCGRETTVSEELFGSAVRCPSCFREFVFESVRFANGRGSGGGGSAGVNPADRSSRLAGSEGTSRDDRIGLGTIGRFELRERIGEGGFGVVFRAFDPVLDREAAVKVPQLALGDERTSRRFLAEAKAAARLRHPGIVAVYEAGIAEGRPYIAAELVRGQTLAERLKAGRPVTDVAVSWVRDLARALAYAHSEGVIHRDVKPGNVMLDRHDRPQLMDFGLARYADAESSLTADGSVLGTPAYMSPEQARGDTAAIGPKSDQYGLGAILYELLSGSKPFVGPPHAVVSQVASPDDPPSLRSRDPALPRDLESICRRAMEKDPASRYATTAALADDLARWLAGEETVARPLPAWERSRRWARKRPAVAGWTVATLMTAAVGFFLVLHQWRRAERHLSDLLDQREANTALVDEAHSARDRAESARATAVRERKLAERRGAELAAALAESQRNLAEATRQRERADAAGAEADRLSGEVAGEKAEADRQRGQATLLTIRRLLDQGQELAESGQAVAGLLRLAEALRSLPANAEDLEWHLRMSLALHRRNIHEPSRVIDAGGGVRSVDIHPTGLLVATGDEAGRACVWDAESGIEMLRLPDFDGPIRAVRFSPDGERLLICGGSGAAELWDVSKDAAEPDRLRHPSAVTAGAFDGTGRVVATGSEDRYARLWNVAAARLAIPPLEHEGPVRAVALNADGTLLLTGTAELARRVVLWDATIGRRLGVLYDGASDVTAVAFSPAGTLAAAGLADGTVRFWRAADRTAVLGAMTAEGPVRDLAFISEGQLLVAAGEGAARLWDVETGRLLGQPLRHAGGVTAVASVRSSHVLVTAGTDGVVRMWRTAASKQVEGPIPHEGPVTHVALSADGRLLATGGPGGVVRLFDVAAGTTLGEPVSLGGAVGALAFDPNGRTVACGASDGSCRLLGTASGTLGPRLRHDAAVTFAAFTPDGHRLVTAEKDGAVRVWDPETAKPAGPPLSLAGGVQSVALSPDGKRVAGGGEGVARVWDTATGTPISKPFEVAGTIASLSIGRDGRTLLVGTEAGDVARWDVETGRESGPAFSHGGPLHTVASGPDDRLALTAGATAVRLWDTSTGEPFGPPLEHDGEVTTAFFRSDGRFLVMGTMGGDVLIWDAVLGRPVGLPLRCPGPVERIATTEGDAVLAVATGGKVAQVWRIPPPVTVEGKDAVAWAELVTGARLDDRGTVVSLSADEWGERRDRIEEGEKREDSGEAE